MDDDFPDDFDAMVEEAEVAEGGPGNDGYGDYDFDTMYAGAATPQEADDDATGAGGKGGNGAWGTDGERSMAGAGGRLACGCV